jgi:glutamate--cysteine ligase
MSRVLRMTRLTEDTAERYVAEHCLEPGPTGFVGAAVEVLATALLPVEPPPGPVFHRLRHGHLTGDYAGVLTVSSPSSPGLDVAVRRMATDLATARLVLARAGFAPGERAIDTHRPVPPFVADAAVSSSDTAAVINATNATVSSADTAAAFSTGTAAVRISLEAGPDGPGLADRWATAQAIGPILAAAFANSPLRDGRSTGWRSTRQAMRLALDTPPPPGDPRTSWTSYALDQRFHPTTVSFRQALRDGRVLTAADLRRHLDGLPAPVRARGHLELSMIDAQPGEGWRIALAVTTALIDDPRAAEEARAAAADLPADAWTCAARDALTDTALAEAARRCFLAAYAALARQGTDRHLRDEVATYIDRYVSRARTPADDLLDALRTTT